MRDCRNNARGMAVGRVVDPEDRALERVGNVKVSAAVEDHRVGDPGSVTERDYVRAAVPLRDRTLARRAYAGNRRDIVDRGGAVEIRCNALDLGPGTDEVADVGDIDLLVDAIEFQTEQRRDPEVARGDEMAVPVVPQ